MNHLSDPTAPLYKDHLSTVTTVGLLCSMPLLIRFKDHNFTSPTCTLTILYICTCTLTILYIHTYVHVPSPYYTYVHVPSQYYTYVHVVQWTILDVGTNFLILGVCAQQGPTVFHCCMHAYTYVHTTTRTYVMHDTQANLV